MTVVSERMALLKEAMNLDHVGPIEEAFLLKRYGASVPDELYHYTNDVGLYGILQSGRFRVSDVFSMNDPSEIQYGYDVFYQRARDHGGTAEDGTRFAEFIGGIESFQKHVVVGPVADALNYFCASFSTRSPDDLSQWRSYGANGRGYCIVFDGARLPGAFRSLHDFDQHVYAISYEASELIEVYDEVLARIYDLWLRFFAVPESDGGDGELWRKLRIRVANCLHEFFIRLAPYFKHPAYKAEEEFRFGLRAEHGGAADKWKTLMRPDRMVRYYDFDWTKLGKNTLKEIVIGPAAVSHAEKFVSDCLREFDYDNAKVRRSTIPYRVY